MRWSLRSRKKGGKIKKERSTEEKRGSENGEEGGMKGEGNAMNLILGFAGGKGKEEEEEQTDRHLILRFDRRGEEERRRGETEWIAKSR